MTSSRSKMLLVVGLIVAGGILPVAAYWLAVGRAPELTPQQARQMLADPSANAVLVDVRPAGEYAAGHLAGSINWPLADIQTLRPGMPLPPALANRRLLLVCNSGWNSGRAVILLRRLDFTDAYNVRGGMQRWSAAAGPACPIGIALAAAGPGTPTSRPAVVFRPAPAPEQWAAVLTGFGVKPTYMLLSLVLAGVLWRRGESDLACLRWALLAFFIGEAFCAANYLFAGEESCLFEYLHSFGMVLAFAFTACALLDAMDLRLIHYSHPGERCAAVPLCRACIKHAQVGCGLRRVFIFLIPAAMALAAMPLCADVRTTAYATRIFATDYAYIHPAVHQIYELRVLPVLAIGLLAASMLVLLIMERFPVSISRILFCAGLGALGFSLFRLVLFSPFTDNQVWFAFWEEITELLYVLGVGAVLLIFRRGLLPAAG